MEPTDALFYYRVFLGVLILCIVLYGAYEGHKMYALHQHYKRRREMYAALNAEVEEIEQRTEEEARKHGNV